MVGPERLFKFGDSRRFQSCGRVFFQNEVSIIGANPVQGNSLEASNQKEIITTLQAEVIDADVPYLLSRSSLAKMNAAMSFKDRTLWISESGCIQLSENGMCHLIFPFDLSSSRCTVTVPKTRDIYASPQKRSLWWIFQKKNRDGYITIYDIPR